MPHQSRSSQAEVPSVTSYGQVIEYIQGMDDAVYSLDNISLTWLLSRTKTVCTSHLIPTRQTRRLRFHTQRPSSPDRRTKDHRVPKLARRASPGQSPSNRLTTSPSTVVFYTMLSTRTLALYTLVISTALRCSFMKFSDTPTTTLGQSFSGAMQIHGVSVMCCDLSLI